jgi:hypothetical protein
MKEIDITGQPWGIEQGVQCHVAGNITPAARLDDDKRGVLQSPTIYGRYLQDKEG